MNLKVTKENEKKFYFKNKKKTVLSKILIEKQFFYPLIGRNYKIDKTSLVSDKLRIYGTVSIILFCNFVFPQFCFQLSEIIIYIKKYIDFIYKLRQNLFINKKNNRIIKFNILVTLIF